MGIPAAVSRIGRPVRDRQLMVGLRLFDPLDGGAQVGARIQRRLLEVGQRLQVAGEVERPNNIDCLLYTSP